MVVKGGSNKMSMYLLGCAAMARMANSRILSPTGSQSVLVGGKEAGSATSIHPQLRHLRQTPDPVLLGLASITA